MKRPRAAHVIRVERMSPVKKSDNRQEWGVGGSTRRMEMEREDDEREDVHFLNMTFVIYWRNKLTSVSD